MRRILGYALLVMAFAIPAAAQVTTSTTGAINGSVADNTKAMLPGVTVSIESPQMIGGARETVTDERGGYQFAAIPPGEYKVTFNLPGFAVLVREGIRVGLGFTATVNVELQVATQQETITVSGESPVVDTTATNVTNNFDAETIANLPHARDFPSLMAETPGVQMTRIDVGGSAAMSETGFTIYGMSNGGNSPVVEGIEMGGQFYNDFGSFQEVQISTAAHTAEMAVPGVLSRMIAKSGGNQYHASFYTDYETDSWGTRNISDDQIRRGVVGGGGIDAKDTNRVDKYRDINGDLGGYVMKDKLWWYGSLRYNASDVGFVNFPVKPQYTRLTNRSGKVTYNLSQNNKFIGYYNYVFKYQPERFVSKNHIHYSLDEPWDEDFPVGNWKAEYNRVMSQSMFLEARTGVYFYDFYNFNRASNKPLYVDSTTQERFGGTSSNLSHQRRPQFNGSLSYFRSGWGNSHNLKFGWEIARYEQTRYEYGRGDRDHYLDPTFGGINIEHQLRNGVPNQVLFTLSPSTSTNYNWTFSTYVNDAWQLNNHFSFNIGMRFDRYRNGSPEQVKPADMFNPQEIRFAAIPDAFHFNTIGPRLGIVWDVRGNGKTVVKSNWGAYPWRPSNSVAGQNPNPQTWTRTYTWVDANGDRLWQPGEETRLVSQVGGIGAAIIDPSWENNITSELVTQLERELFPNFGIRTGLIWRGDSKQTITDNPNRPFEAYNVPVQVLDPGPDGRAGTADDGGFITAYNLDPALLSTPQVQRTTHNRYVDGDDHYTWEIAANRRMTGSWSVNASYAQTWSMATPGSVNTTFNTNPNKNMFIGTDSDGRRHYTTWQAKLSGTMRLAHDIKLSPVIRHQAGDPYGRTINVSLNYGSQTIQVEPESSRRVSNINIFDVRMEKGLNVMGKRAAFFLDVFNILNSNGEQEIVQSSGATFERPVVIISPRVARVGAKFEW